MSRSDREPRLVPVYALTEGRTRSVGHDLPWEAVARTTTAGVSSLARLPPEQARIVELCRVTQSVAEISSQVGVPLGVARVLVSDLSAAGLLTVHLPRLTEEGRPAVEVLERLLAGLKRGA